MCWNDTERGRIRDESVDSVTRGFRAEARESADVKLEKGIHSSLSDIAL